MKVVLDGRIVLPRTTGAGRYVIELARHLPIVDPSLDLTVLLRPVLRGTAVPRILDDAGVRLQYVDARVASARQWVMVPGALRDLKPDLYHYPFLDLPFVEFPSVVTVFDLNPLIHPEYFDRYRAVKRRIFRILSASTFRRCRVALAISDATRRTVEQLFRVEPRKLRTVLLGVDPGAWAGEGPGGSGQSADAGAADGAWAGREHVLYLGVDRPHKNLYRLVRGFAAFRARDGWAPGAGPYLWLAGVGAGSRAVREAITALGLQQDVRLSGPVAEVDLRSVYRSARAFAYVSTSEGFGLPVLEAFAAGVPVVASAASSLPEVGGDAVEYADPQSEAAIADALARVWGDDARRRTLIERGRKRLLRFSWKATAVGTRQAYADALGDGKARSVLAGAGSSAGRGDS